MRAARSLLHWFWLLDCPTTSRIARTEHIANVIDPKGVHQAKGLPIGAFHNKLSLTSLGGTATERLPDLGSQDVLVLLKQVRQLQAELADKPDLSPAASKAVVAVQAMMDAQSAMQPPK